MRIQSKPASYQHAYSNLPYVGVPKKKETSKADTVFISAEARRLFHQSKC